MRDVVSLLTHNSNRFLHAKYFLTQYKNLFNWTPPEDILEVGCSHGSITQEVLYPFVKPYLKHLTATDIAPNAIEFAAKNNKKSDLSFQTLNILDVNECDNYLEKFNHIFAFHVFHNSGKPDLWSKNTFKMLKPNGQLYTHTVVERPNLCNMATSQLRKDESKPWFDYIKNINDIFYDYGPDPLNAIKNILTNVGFTIDAIDIEPKTMAYENVDELKNTFMSVNYFLNYIPKEFHDQYEREFAEKLLKYVTRNEDGSCSYIFNVVSVLATKPKI